ncbi:MAG: sugar nucleotide-binding protein [Oligoflexia bacterium]|nr:sugar nucleotide-binding protein [Oligoflexia bacterium]
MNNSLKKVLIVGGSSLVGKGMINYFEQNKQNKHANNFDLFCSIKKTWNYPFPTEKTFQMDLLSRIEIQRTLENIRPDIVVFAASEGRVDVCENNKDDAKKINVESLKDFLEILNTIKKPELFIYISSNAVFSGENAPYSEEDHLSPVNYYGKTKVDAENVVTEMSKGYYVIIRPILLIGMAIAGRRKSAIEFFLERLHNGDEVRAVDDVFCNPLHANFLAAAIWDVIAHRDICKEQIFHIGGKDRLSRYDLVLALCKSFNLNEKLVVRSSASEFSNLTQRAADTTYATNKASMMLNWHPPDIYESLELLKKEWMQW